MKCHIAKIPAIAGAAVLAAGCQTYRPRPIDAAAHAASFLARAPGSTELAAFAAAMRAPGDGKDPDFDLSDGVTLEEAEAVALLFNPDLREARESAGVTRASAEHAGLWEDPVLGVDLARIVQSVPHPLKASARLGLTLPVSGRLDVERRRAGLEHAVELARLAQHEWRVRMELRRAWARWTAAALQAQSTRAFLAQIERVLSAVDAAEQAGEMPRVEARLFRIESATRSAELGVLESRREEAALEILRLMGLSPVAEIRFVPVALDGAAPDVSADGSAAWLGAPPVVIASAEFEVAERTFEREVLRQYPDLTIGPGWGLEDGRDELLLGLSVPLPFLNANRRLIAEARAGRDAARMRVEAAVERVVSDLHAARQRLSAARAQRRVLEEGVLPLVEAQYADLRRTVELGQARAYVLLDSLTRMHETRAKVIDAALVEALAAIRVVEVLGPGATSPVSRSRHEGSTP